MSSTATTTTTATKKDRSSSSASQKFWPLKKFGLHHGKTDEQKQIPLSETVNKASDSTAASVETNAKVINEKKNTATIITPEQKKSKNKRLGSLLSSNRRDEGNTQSHVNTPDSNSDINENSKKQNTTNASNTPTLTKKAGREIANKSRATATTITTSAKQQNMTTKSAGSGTLARSTTYNNRSLRGSKTARKVATFEDKVVGNKRPQSPPAKRNDSPTQPNIMLESVQQQMQLESSSNEEGSCLAFEEDVSKSDYEDEKLYLIAKNTTINTTVKENIDAQQPAKNPELVILNEIENKAKPSLMLKSETNKEDENRKEMGAKEKERERIIKNMNVMVQHDCNNTTLPPSPPITPAATSTTANSLEFSSSTCLRDNGISNDDAAGVINIHSNHSGVTEEPVGPTMCAFEVPSVLQQQHNKSEIDKLNQQNTLYMQQQSMQRSIQRLRPAASFATLRQLASTNNTFQYQQQQQQQQLQQIQKIKRRPASFIESSSNNMNYFNYAVSPPPVATNDDYLTVNSSGVSPVRPMYYRRASSEDNRHFHIRQLSDNNIQTVTYNNIDSRRLVRSNTVHNLIIKDGHGHRIVQCVGGLDPSQLLQRKASNCENELVCDWSPPEMIVDEMLLRQQQLEEQQLHQQQLSLIQQHQNQLAALAATQQDNMNDASSSSSGSSTNNRRIERKDSAKSISSLCSGSPTITGYDTKLEKLKTKLEKERATVKALQKQKEACSKDLVFLSKNVDDLTADNAEWKKKFESEKTLKERFQDDLSSTMDKFNEAAEHIRQLENQTKALKSEIDEKNKEIRELEKKKQQSTPTTRGGKSSNRVLAAQLQHSQNQVRLLKSTMEQFLRMGVFNDDLNSSLSNLTSPTVSIDAIVSEFKCGGRSKQQQRRNTNHDTSFSFDSPTINKSPTTVTTTNLAASTLIDEISISTDGNSIPTPTSTAATTLQPPESTISRKSLVLSENQENGLPNMATKAPEKRLSRQQDDLDIELRELLREKELLQAEYSKAPSSGGNAIIRRRREELESRLDTVDSQMCRIKLKMRSRHII